MTFNGAPKLPSQEDQSSRPKPVLTLDELQSENRIHGLGYERFSAQERTEYAALLSRLGSPQGDPVLANIKGETIIEIMEYVRGKDPVSRTQSFKRIQEAYKKATEEYYAS